jgi:hypothetical protein
MPRQCILTAAERSALLAFPIEKSELIRLYTFSEQDLSVIKQRRGDANRLGFAVLLCALRYPGQALSTGERPPNSFLTMVARQLGIDETVWDQYGERCRGATYALGLVAPALKGFPLPEQSCVLVKCCSADQITTTHDLYITDPPYHNGPSIWRRREV